MEGVKGTVLYLSSPRSTSSSMVTNSFPLGPVVSSTLYCSRRGKGVDRRWDTVQCPQQGKRGEGRITNTSTGTVPSCPASSPLPSHAVCNTAIVTGSGGAAPENRVGFVHVPVSEPSRREIGAGSAPTAALLGPAAPACPGQHPAQGRASVSIEYIVLGYGRREGHQGLCLAQTHCQGAGGVLRGSGKKKEEKKRQGKQARCRNNK